MSAGQTEEPGDPGDVGLPVEGRHRRPRQPAGRRRWLVAAGVVAAFTGMVAPPAESQPLNVVGNGRGSLGVPF